MRTRHFVAYHYTEKMGRTLVDGNPLAVVSNKSLKHLYDNAVWFIQGDAGQLKCFSLASVFVVNEVRETGQRDFKWDARGEGQVFVPPIRINEMPWFGDLFKTTGRFAFGVSEVKLESVIEGLATLAAGAGWKPATAR